MFFQNYQQILNLKYNQLKKISNTMRIGFLKDIAFFTNKDDAFIATIVPFLTPQNINEKEFVFKSGDHPHASILFKNSLFYI